MPRRKISDSVDEKLNGTFNVKQLYDALVEIDQSQQINMATVKQMLEDSLLKVYKDWWCLRNGFPTANAQDLLAQIEVDWDNGRMHIYDCRKVLNDDDITDDFVEISLDDAQKDFPDIKVDDLYKKEIDYTKLDRGYIKRVVSDFHQRMREIGKQILLDSFASKLGHNITGTVTRVDETNGAQLDFGRTFGTLNKRDMLPDDIFHSGEQVKVFLVGVGEREGKPSLLVSRTNDGYVKALFEEEVPEIADGTVEIVKIVRQAGVRTKIMVASANPNIDPVGVLIGSGSVRYRAVLAELGKETIDILHFPKDPQLLPLEALKPAKIVGLAEPEDPAEPLLAICLNNDKKVAIGRQGCNVRLAGRLIGRTIKILEVDEALAQHVTYTPATQIVQEAQARLAQQKVEEQAAISAPVTPPSDVEIPAETEEEVNEPEREEAPLAETLAEPTPVSEPVVEAKQPEEKVTIVGKAKVSLSALEEEIERERQRKAKTETKFWKKPKPFDRPKDEPVKTEESPATTDKNAPNKSALPIYTAEELAELEKEDEQPGTADRDFEDYDDDSFYDEDDKHR